MYSEIYQFHSDGSYELIEVIADGKSKDYDYSGFANHLIRTWDKYGWPEELTGNQKREEERKWGRLFSYK